MIRNRFCKGSSSGFCASRSRDASSGLVRGTPTWSEALCVSVEKFARNKTSSHSLAGRCPWDQQGHQPALSPVSSSFLPSPRNISTARYMCTNPSSATWLLHFSWKSPSTQCLAWASMTGTPLRGRSIEASHNRAVIADLDCELLLKKLCRRGGRVLLKSANDCYTDFNNSKW